jgi:bifunctional UDP-N-acetylglucosamine pyrophosphorylase / glucosamine-1-phosphate N-acetyltransferase
MSDIAVVILAAGRGTRMQSERPKVLHPIAGRPMILHLLEAVAALGPTHTVIVRAEDAPGFDEALAGSPVPVKTVVQTERRGTGHALLQAKEKLAGFSGDLLVLYGDAPLAEPRTMRALLDAQKSALAPSLMVLGMRPSDAGEYGRLITDINDMLISIVEFRDATRDQLDEETLCNAGPIAGPAELIFDLLAEVGSDNAKGEVYLTDIIGLARGRGLDCAVVEADATEALGVNSRADLAAIEAIVQERLRGRALDAGATLTDPAATWFSYDTKLGRDVSIGPNVQFGPGVEIGDNVEIRAFCHLEGATIAAGATIGPFARLRPGAAIGEGARVGNFVEIKNASVEAGAKINHLAYVGDARVGEKANVGAGTITCNYDGLRKAHTDIGAGAFIGSNTALVAPVAVGERAVVGAGSTITRDVEADAVAVARGEQTVSEGGAKRRRERAAKAKAGD